MKDFLDDFAGRLQDQIFEETGEAIRGEEHSSRWQNPKLMGK